MKVYVVEFLFNDEEVVLDSIWSEEEGAASRATKIGGWYIDMWIEDLP